MHSSRDAFRPLQWPSGWASRGWCVQGVCVSTGSVRLGSVSVGCVCPRGCIQHAVGQTPPVDRILLRTAMMCFSFRRMILLVLILANFAVSPLLTVIALSAVQPFTLTQIHSAILFIDTSDNA